MTAYYEKPKGWSEAPRESWVSGTPIGQDNIGMPKLGDPDAHQESSSKVSFGDDGMPVLDNGIPGLKCGPGKTAKDGVCVHYPESEATLESKIKEVQRGSKQGGKDVSVGKKERRANPFKRDIEGAPRGGKPDPQIARLAKEGKRE